MSEMLNNETMDLVTEVSETMKDSGCDVINLQPVTEIESEGKGKINVGAIAIVGVVVAAAGVGIAKIVKTVKKRRAAKNDEVEYDDFDDGFEDDDIAEDFDDSENDQEPVEGTEESKKIKG
jgi:hypothetical protein